MNCKWAGSDQPRELSNGDPCPEAHCRVCGRTHADGTCAECMALTREALRDIARMCDALPEEVEHRGVESEAMMLLGPSADPEARGHLEASVLAGRLPADWIDAGRGDTHPKTVIATWDMVWRDALEHEEDERWTLARGVDYLDRQMTYMGGYWLAPFEDFARDLRRCRAHVEAVLHDGEQIDTGAPCMDCRIPLVREWGKLATADGWRCPRCTKWRSDMDYRLNVAALHSALATHLTDRDMEQRTGVKAGTIRKWAQRGLVARRLDSGRVLYAVSDVQRLAGISGEVVSQ